MVKRLNAWLRSRWRARRNVAVLMVLAAAVGCVCLWTNAKDDITWEGFEKVELGMSEKEIERILGSPSGQYFTGKIQWIIIEPKGVDLIRGDRGELVKVSTYQRFDLIELQKRGTKAWIGNRCGIWVKFDADGRATLKGAGSVTHLRRDLCSFQWFR